MRTFVKEFGREPKMYHYTLKNYLSVFQTNQYQKFDFFQDPKFKKYVLNNCSKRINTMVNGNSLLEYKHYSEWKKITGHEVKMY